MPVETEPPHIHCTTVANYTLDGYTIIFAHKKKENNNGESRSHTHGATDSALKSGGQLNCFPRYRS